jgi:nucleotide-binding universal stress UspA family protein
MRRGASLAVSPEPVRDEGKGEIMFENIIVGLKEGLEESTLLDLASGVAQPGARIHLVTLLMIGTNEDEAQRLRQAEHRLEQRVKSLEQAGFTASSEVGLRPAAAATELLRIADRRGSDLIVIGLAKRSRVGKALMGSDAQRVLIEAGCPVLTTRLAD